LAEIPSATPLGRTVAITRHVGGPAVRQRFGEDDGTGEGGQGQADQKAAGDLPQEQPRRQSGEAVRAAAGAGGLPAAAQHPQVRPPHRVGAPAPGSAPRGCAPRPPAATGRRHRAEWVLKGRQQRKGLGHQPDAVFSRRFRASSRLAWRTARRLPAKIRLTLRASPPRRAMPR